MKAHIQANPYEPKSQAACGDQVGEGDVLVSQAVAGGILFRGPSPLRKVTAQQLCGDCLNALHAGHYQLYFGQ